jgi:hypothetical protein
MQEAAAGRLPPLNFSPSVTRDQEVKVLCVEQAASSTGEAQGRHREMGSEEVWSKPRADEQEPNRRRGGSRLRPMTSPSRICR